MEARKRIVLSDKHKDEECDTLFYQGYCATQVQALKYIGNQKITATTGEIMWCTGRNNLPPLNVIYKLHIGPEISDVNLHPYDSYTSMLNPIKLRDSVQTWISNKYYGYHFHAPLQAYTESVRFAVPIYSQISFGQETDMQSHRKKYDSWLEKEDRTSGLILWGVSRGTAATFCAFAKEKYKEVKLVVLEGAVDSMPEVFENIYSHRVVSAINTGLSFFTQYRPDGPSPLKMVADFPENIPVVFITSKIDSIYSNTENIACALARKGKNDVYLLKLERSNHATYMFDDGDDHDCYETFIHAIYKKYNLKHDSELARKGEDLISTYTLCEVESKMSYLKKVS